MASEKNKNARNARLLLGAYWISRVLRGKSIPETTWNVLQIQGNSLKKEFRERHGTEKSAGKKPILSAGKASGSIPAKKMPAKILGFILKKERLF